MTKKILLLIFSIIIISGCSSDTNKDIYRTKSGEYASKTGSFIAKFPTKPKLTVIENQIGLDKFEINHYRSTLGSNKIFSIEYTDYPEYLLKSTTDDQLYSQAIKNISNKVADDFKLEVETATEQHGLSGKYFVLEFNKDIKGKKPYIEGKIFRNVNRVFTVMYTGITEKKVDEFMSSFRLIK